jgi:hypothetical protein
MDKLISGWHLLRPWVGLGTVLVLQVVIRAFLTLLRTLEHHPAGAFWIDYRRDFLGFHPDKNRADYWFPSILGLLELISYPVLMVTGAWTVIGAWIGFKTFAQLEAWKKDRNSFNRYLIGNALVVILSLLCLTQFVGLTQSGR